jgi:hypothetical protein
MLLATAQSLTFPVPRALTKLSELVRAASTFPTAGCTSNSIFEVGAAVGVFRVSMLFENNSGRLTVAML